MSLSNGCSSDKRELSAAHEASMKASRRLNCRPSVVFAAGNAGRSGSPGSTAHPAYRCIDHLLHLPREGQLPVLRIVRPDAGQVLVRIL